jgi:hypothetical protein
MILRNKWGSSSSKSGAFSSPIIFHRGFWAHGRFRNFVDWPLNIISHERQTGVVSSWRM